MSENRSRGRRFVTINRFIIAINMSLRHENRVINTLYSCYKHTRNEI